MTLMTPGGTPASSMIGINASIVSGVSEAGLSTTGQPAARAGAIFRAAIAAGEFHGGTRSATPAGRWWTRMRAPHDRATETSPMLRTASSPYHPENSAAYETSLRESGS